MVKSCADDLPRKRQVAKAVLSEAPFIPRKTILQHIPLLQSQFSNWQPSQLNPQFRKPIAPSQLHCNHRSPLRGLHTAAHTQSLKPTRKRPIFQATPFPANNPHRNDISSTTFKMITDSQLYSLALFLGAASMLLIVLYHFLEINSKEEELPIDGDAEKVAGSRRAQAGRG